MSTTMLRGVFDSYSAANQAASQLRERGLREVYVQSEPAERAAQPEARRAGGAAPAFAFSVLIGAIIGVIAGFVIGFPFLGIPSVRNDLATIILTMLAWIGGGALLGAIGGAIIGGLFGSALTRKTSVTSAQADASNDHEQVVVIVSVEGEVAAEKARRLLRELSAQTVEAHASDVR
jgi:hypothetical protein